MPLPDMGSDALSDGYLAEIPPNAAILIAGPPMTGKYQLLLSILHGHAESVLLISTKNGFQRVRDDFRRIAGEFDPDRLAIVDCVSYHEPVEADEAAGRVVFTDSPENLTRIGVKFTGLFEDFVDDPEAGHLGVGIHSISQLMMHSEVKQVYQFLQVLVGQIRNAGSLVVGVLDTASTDDETVQTLQQHFDGLVLTRENDAGARQFRIRGLTPQTTDWTEF